MNTTIRSPMRRSDREELRFSNRRSPCPICGARHGFAALLDNEEGGKCHACGAFVPPDRSRSDRPFVPIRRTPAPPPKPERPIVSITPWEHFTTYDYYDEHGIMLFHVDRYHRDIAYEDGETERAKTFRQRPAGVHRFQKNDVEATPIGASMAGVRLVLYELPSILSAIREGGTIWIVEGEKAADKLNLWLRHEYGYADRATTAPGGAKGWRPEYAEIFADADVMVWSDADRAGHEHRLAVQESLAFIAKSVHIIDTQTLEEVLNVTLTDTE